MTRKRPSRLRDEVRALRAEVALLRAELAMARVPVLPTQPAPQPWDVSPPVPVGGCSACRWSGVCNCVRYDQMPRTFSYQNANACAGGVPITIYDTTGAAPQLFQVDVTQPAAGAASVSIIPFSGGTP